MKKDWATVLTLKIIETKLYPTVFKQYTYGFSKSKMKISDKWWNPLKYTKCESIEIGDVSKYSKGIIKSYLSVCIRLNKDELTIARSIFLKTDMTYDKVKEKFCLNIYIFFNIEAKKCIFILLFSFYYRHLNWLYIQNKR